jgi:hypothetical protein
MKRFFSDRYAVKRAISEYRWTIFLLVLSFFLLFVLLIEWGVMSWRNSVALHQLNEKTSQSAPQVTENEQQIPALLPMESYKQTVERPVFMEGRKPGAEPWMSQDRKTNTASKTLTLSGVILTTSTAEALLADEQNHRKRLKKGESWNGWLLQDVYFDHVLLEQGSERMEVSLYKKKKQGLGSGQPSDIQPGTQPASEPWRQ